MLRVLRRDKLRDFRADCLIQRSVAPKRTLHKCFVRRDKLPWDPLYRCIPVLKSNRIPNVIDISNGILIIGIRYQERDRGSAITQCCSERISPNMIRSNGACLS